MTGLEIGIIAVVGLAFIFCIGMIVGGTLYRRWKFTKGGFDLVWNHKDTTMKALWEKVLPEARTLFDAKGAQYGFWKPGEFLNVSGYMKVEVDYEYFDLGKRGLAAGLTMPGKKHVKVCLALPKRDENKNIIGTTLMGTGAPWDGALIHEWNHFAYEYIYREFDYNHAQDGDGMGAKNGCWTPEHDKFINEVQDELRKKFSNV